MFKSKSILFAALATFTLFSCSEETAEPDLRTKIDYSLVTATTPYKKLFVDAKGDTTVDFKAGNSRYRMFQALNYYLGGAVRESKILDVAVMKNMYANSGNPFVDVPTLNIKGADLNTSGVQLKNVTSSSKSTADADIDRARLEAVFGEMGLVSQSHSANAAKNTPGKLGTYLVDGKGIEIAQIIQKSLIGALQLDYIGNVLLDKGLTAENKKLVAGKNYTQLEQNWDEAYGMLTLSPVYLDKSTDAVRGTAESFLGSYLWEYNKPAYPKMHLAFVKGRAAIVNNDLTEVKTQATFIRTESEKAIAAAALGYLGKWKSGTTDAARAHAIGEGLGFIYSLRFCKLNGADAAFSDAILVGLVGSPGGFWDLTNDKINAASEAIATKFKL